MEFCFAFQFVPPDQQKCMCMWECLHVLCVSISELVLQALVEVDGGGEGTGLSYPLLQICFKPTHFHRATKGWLNMMKKNVAVCLI